jgi:hypothetical protein
MVEAEYREAQAVMTQSKTTSFSGPEGLHRVS